MKVDGEGMSDVTNRLIGYRDVVEVKKEELK
jgi:hypothetical protein